ncbi:type 1 glutamine amidotransferase [Natrialba sp. SSL1]|uniref:type 1 glutamine amidotransferase n=1 Tax=Natrialba sp. SSL1 TaxID=1869245 RepID=UPI0008F8FA7E|nr:gamma-glutamyl-gamma-aminobutyrate hydrolase family protein [Natrialba sp. SSL1]OIB59021.1 glutamine amidotransferase [Natrialba sp. SSL1]
MILVLDLEVQPDYRYLAPEIARLTPGETEYRVFVDEPVQPDLEPYDGVILSGSTASVYDDEHADWIEPAETLIRRCRDENVPLLGVCFGHQLIHQALGGVVKQDERRATFVQLESTAGDDQALADLDPVVPVLHADLVVDPADVLESTAQTEYNAHFCSRHTEAPIWTVQFHPEFTERVRDEPSDWADGDHSFEDSNATRVLENFGRYCRGDE